MFIFGFTFATVCFVCCKTGVYSAFAAIAAAVVVLLVFFLVRSLRKTLEIPLVATAVLLSAVIFLMFFNFSYKKAISYDGETAFTGKIISLPQKSYGVYHYEIETETIGDRFVKLKLLYASPDELYHDVFDCISVSDAKIYVPRDSDGNESEHYKSHGIFLRAYSIDLPEVLFTYEKSPFYYVLMLRRSIIDSVLKRTSGDRAGIIIAMLLSDTSYISAETRANFTNSGAAHLLSVSGLHVSLWVSFLMSFFTIFGVNKKTSNVLSLIFLVFFILLTGFSVSVMRASFMLAVVLIAPFFKRRSDPLNSLGIAVFLITAANPFSVLSVSLQLSVTATLGIITIGKYFINRFAKLITRIRVTLPRRFIRYIVESIIITLCSFIATLPVTVSVFGRVSLVAPLTNLLVVGLSSLAMIFGGTGVIMSYSQILLPVCDLWYAIADFLADVILKCVTALGSLTYATLLVDTVIYSFWLVATLIILLGGATILYKRKTHLPLEITAAVCVLFFIIGNCAAMAPSKQGIKGTVLPINGSPVIMLQSGRHYALIGCPRDTGSFTYELNRYLPQLPSTSFDLLLMPYENFGIESYQNIKNDFSPKETFADFHLYTENKDILGNQTYFGTQARYLLWGEIDIAYYNKQKESYVIIKFNEKIIMVSLSPDNDMRKIGMNIATPDILICPDHLPKYSDAILYDEIIITGNPSKTREHTYNQAQLITPNTHFTAYEGSIGILNGREKYNGQA